MLGAEINGEYMGRNSRYSRNIKNMKKRYKQNASSPVSPLSYGTSSYGSIDLAMDNAIDNSHEQLHQRICDMKCLEEAQSIQDGNTTYGNELRMNSDLCIPIEAHHHILDTEVVKDVVVKEEQENNPQCKKKKLNKNIKEREATVKANNVAFMTQKPPISKRIKSRRTNSGSSDEILSSKNQNLSGGLTIEKGIDNPDLGPYLLKKARDIISSGDNLKRAFELLIRAKKSFESCSLDKKNLDYVMCLHILASMHSSAGNHKEAMRILEHAIEIPSTMLGHKHALAKFVGCMQLGDIYAMKAQLNMAIHYYKIGLEIQKEVLGDKDTHFGQTCRYVAEAYIQIFEFDEAKKLCKMALDIHKVNGCSPSIEEASDRRLMGLICDSNGNYEEALEHYMAANLAMHCNGQEADVATVNCNIGDTYLALARYDEAIDSYNKAITTFTSSKGKNHPTVASVFVRLGELYNKVGKFGESKSYCERALEIYNKPLSNGTNVEDIANGLTNLAIIYESMNELDESLNLLHKALELHSDEVVSKSKIAGIEAQIGVLYFMLGNYIDSYNFLKSSILNFEVSEEKTSCLYAITLSQLGLTCVQLYAISEAAELFDKAKSILEKVYGSFHQNTLWVYSNLAATYDVLGRWDDAIELLEFVVVTREEKLGTADPIVEDEKRRLAKLLDEAGKVRRRKSRSLETLFYKNTQANLIIAKGRLFGL